MYQKKKIPIMVIVILILQIAFPILSVTIESALTPKSIAYDGTEYYINTAQDMWDFAELVNSGDTFKGVTVYLTADIDLNCSETKQWIPIGNSNTNSSSTNSLIRFDGIFDGQNHKIMGIYISTDEKNQGLFGFNTGIIKRLTIEGEISSSDVCTGAVAGLNGGSITGVINNATICGGDYLGGICGENSGEIISCTNNATITGIETVTYNKIGGIAGYNRSRGSIKNCNNLGIINGNESESLISGVGGIVGYNEATVENCINNAKINNNNNTGGIIGNNICGSIKNCTNNAEIIGEKYIGGIIGYNNYSKNYPGYSLIYNCLNTGHIKSTQTLEESFAGGIVGYNDVGNSEARSSIIKCQNDGLVEGSALIGGICGFSGNKIYGENKNTYIRKCINTGDVKSNISNTTTIEIEEACVGGIIGCNYCGYVEECYNKGNIEGLNVVGGIAGVNHDCITNCYNNGEVKATVSSENNSSNLNYVESAGIVSYNYGNVEFCYNTGKITASVLDNLSFNGYASGLVSINSTHNSKDAIIKNCYTVGQLQAKTNTCIIGMNRGIATDCYYLDTTCNEQYEETDTQTIKSKTSNSMKTPEFIELLNSTAFKIDSNNENNGYPVLKDIQRVSITFDDEILYHKVLENLFDIIDNYDDEMQTIYICQKDIDSVKVLDLNSMGEDKNNRIKNLMGIEYFTNLTELNLGYNTIDDISKLSDLTKIKSLNLSGNQISDISHLQYLTKLIELDLSTNKISDISSLKNLTGLKVLNLHWNQINDISSLQSLTNLTKLDLTYNKIDDISSLQDMTNLTRLDLDSNQIYDISSLQGMTNLTELYLSGNQINDIESLYNLQKLSNFYIWNQQLLATITNGEEVELPKIFIQAKDEQGKVYTDEDFILTHCSLSADGTKVMLDEEANQGIVKIKRGET